MTGPAEAAEVLLRAPVEAAGCELVDVVWAPGLLRVSVDRPGGIDLEAIADLTPVLSAVLDEAEPDPVPGRYTLEVSSPGLERPLRTPAHFARVVGTKVNLKLRPGAGVGDADRRLTGVLEAADDLQVTVAGSTVALADIEKATTVFEWGPKPKPGKAPKQQQAPKQQAKQQAKQQHDKQATAHQGPEK